MQPCPDIYIYIYTERVQYIYMYTVMCAYMYIYCVPGLLHRHIRKTNVIGHNIKLFGSAGKRYINFISLPFPALRTVKKW